MKKFINITNIALIFFSCTLFFSCGGDDDPSDPSPNAVAPTLTVNESSLEIMFFQTGSATPYSVDWHGSKGSFSLETPLTGLSIDANSGKLSWSKQLPIGIHDVIVKATNSAGSVQKTITLQHPLQGVFNGFYKKDGNTYPMELALFHTGDAYATYIINNTTYGSSGIWERTDQTIYIELLSEVAPQIEWSMLGEITQGEKAVYKGDWYRGYGSQATLYDVFEVTLDEE